MLTPRTSEDWQALSYEAAQIFSPSAPVDEAALFAGRQTQIRKLIEAVLEKGKHAVLYGERGVGKTSLVKVFHLQPLRVGVIGWSHLETDLVRSRAPRAGHRSGH